METSTAPESTNTNEGQSLISTKFDEKTENESIEETMPGKAERFYSRTFTEVESDNMLEVREALGEDKPLKIFCFPVKHGVSVWNVLAIVLIPICIMLTTTYVNA